MPPVWRGPGTGLSHAIEWSLRLYNHVPPKPVVNGETWYEGVPAAPPRWRQLAI